MFALKRDDVYKIKLIDIKLNKIKKSFLLKENQHDILKNVEFLLLFNVRFSSRP